MRCTIGIIFLTLIGLGLMDPTSADVTREDIRGTLQSLVYSYNQLDNKLERHEHRERVLGELLKNAMGSLRKGLKGLEPLNEIFSRLDERVSQIETLLMTQEETYNKQIEKSNWEMRDIFTWIRENDDCFKRLTPAMISPPAVVSTAAPSAILPPDFIKNQEKINQEMLEKITRLSANVEKLLDTSKNMMEQTEVAFKSVPSTAEMLTKIEDKLVSYSVASIAPQPSTPVDNAAFENAVLEKFTELSNGITELRSITTSKGPDGLTDVDKEFIHGLANETLNALENVKIDALSASDKALAKTTSRLKESEKNIEENINKIFDGVTDSSELLERFYNEMNASYSKFNDGLEIFSKFNNILMTNSEYVLDTQRKVEFGTLQIVQKLSDLLDKHREEITTVMKERFDNVDEGILNSQLEAMQNITSTIESEISHVWRQISIMNGEITDSKDLITLMHGRSEVFVNSTFSSMDSMSNKVEETKNRMLDMDSNLNFLLGKLSVMSQEFKNIKVGLAESLDELRNTFHNMQEKLPPQGPGPHNIAKDKYETEVNLLSKRHTPPKAEE